MQYLVPGRVLTEADQEILTELTEKRAKGKLERVTTFRGMQALSHVSEQLVGRPLCEYDASKHGCYLKPITRDEARHCIVEVDGTKTVTIVSRETGETLYRVLPEGKEDFPQCAFNWDQCLCNSAGYYFMLFHQALVFAHWDRIHRLPFFVMPKNPIEPSRDIRSDLKDSS